MNRTDRLLGIVLELQRKGRQRAEDLAATFETSIRTIYRDVQALSEAGVPVVGSPGQGYSLMDGYFLPPVSFTLEETVALLIGVDFVEQQFDEGYRGSAMSVRHKIEAILPASLLHDVNNVRSGFRLLEDVSTTMKGKPEQETFKLLRRAVQDRRRVRFRYVKNIAEAGGERQSIREVDPYGLVFVNGNWALLAFCHLRQGIRHFRLSRMSELCVLKEEAKLPADFNLQSYQPPDDRDVVVHLLANPSIADKVKQSNYYFIDSMEERQDGLLVTLRIRRLEEVLSWILGWGADIVLMEPASLRNRIREEAAKMFKRY